MTNPLNDIKHWAALSLVEQQPAVDARAVKNLAEKMIERLREAHCNGRAGWDDVTQCSQEYLSALFHRSVAGGELVDAANYAAMLVWRKESLLPSTLCTVPPTGWYCTRQKGHDGPCACIQR